LFLLLHREGPQNEDDDDDTGKAASHWIFIHIRSARISKKQNKT